MNTETRRRRRNLAPKMRAQIEALLGVRVGRVWRDGYRPRGRSAPARSSVGVVAVELRRGKSIHVSVSTGWVEAARWGLYGAHDDPQVAKTIRDILASGDDPGPAVGQRRHTLDEYLDWRHRAVWGELTEQHIAACIAKGLA